MIKEISKKEIFFFFATLLFYVALNLYYLSVGIEFLPIIPLVLITAWIAVKNFSLLYYLLLFSLPFSFEQSFGSLSMSMPTEPLMIVLLAVSISLLIQQRLQLKEQWRHPIILILFLQLTLFTFNIFISYEPLLSLKYLLAKAWYFASFIFIPLLILNNQSAFKKTFWFMFIPLIITVLYTVIRHATKSFGFDEINIAARPFYANHVIYACTLGLLIPFIFMSLGWMKKKPMTFILISLSVLLIIFAIGTSYTRTTWIAVVSSLIALVAFRTAYFKKALLLSMIGVVGFCYYLVDNNHYMKYAPDYQRTIFNEKDFGKHMTATVEMKDVSGMERVYRWVAAVNLIQHHFWLGTGNNTFYPTYKEYANPSFITYVSDNPEHSSTHNYFLLIFCEQGVFGFLLFFSLYIIALMSCYNIFRRSKDPFIRNTITACFLSLYIFLIHLVLGDMVEVDKNGGYFLLILAIIVSLDTMSKKEVEKRISTQ